MLSWQRFTYKLTNSWLTINCSYKMVNDLFKHFFSNFNRKIFKIWKKKHLFCSRYCHVRTNLSTRPARVLQCQQEIANLALKIWCWNVIILVPALSLRYTSIKIHFFDNENQIKLKIDFVPRWPWNWYKILISPEKKSTVYSWHS